MNEEIYNMHLWGHGHCGFFLLVFFEGLHFHCYAKGFTRGEMRSKNQLMNIATNSGWFVKGCGGPNNAPCLMHVIKVVGPFPPLHPAKKKKDGDPGGLQCV